MVNQRVCPESLWASNVARQCVDGESKVCPESAKGDESGCPLGERGTTGARWASEEQAGALGAAEGTSRSIESHRPKK